MLQSVIIVGCSEIHTNTLCVQNVEILSDESGGAQIEVVNTLLKTKHK
jgi:hypothetical protein